LVENNRFYYKTFHYMCYVLYVISIGIESPVFHEYKRERLCFIAIDKKG